MCTLTKRGQFAFLSQVDPCKATVTQRADSDFIPGKQQHNHAGKVGAALTARITARTKKEAVANLFKPVSAIVNQVFLEELTDAPCPSLHKPADLARAANYLRQSLHPTDPKDMEFHLDHNHIPDYFLRKDITVSAFFKKSDLVSNSLKKNKKTR